MYVMYSLLLFNYSIELPYSIYLPLIVYLSIYIVEFYFFDLRYISLKWVLLFYEVIWLTTNINPSILYPIHKIF
jgi:hypothetical protein